MAESIKLSKQQQRILLLVYKFRFVNTILLSKLLEIRRYSVYEVLEKLVAKELVIKVHKNSWRIDRRPAYYHLSKKGVTTVRKLLDVDDRVINTIYNDAVATPGFIQECLDILACYVAIKRQLPEGSVIRTKTEINRYKIFPKQRPELYVKTPDGREAFILIVPDKLPYFVNKRRDEFIEHSEEEGWKGDYPTMAFVLKDNRSKLGFLYKAQQKLEEMGYEEAEISILAIDMNQLLHGDNSGWANAFNPTKFVQLLS